MFHSFTSDTKMWSSCGTHTKITNNVSRLSAGHRLIPRVFEAKSWSSSVHTSLKYFKYNWYMIQDIRLWYTTCHKISGSDTRHDTTRHKISGSPNSLSWAEYSKISLQILKTALWLEVLMVMWIKILWLWCQCKWVNSWGSSSWMWHSVTGLVFLDISKKNSASIFKC